MASPKISPNRGKRIIKGFSRPPNPTHDNVDDYNIVDSIDCNTIKCTGTGTFGGDLKTPGLNTHRIYTDEADNKVHIGETTINTFMDGDDTSLVIGWEDVGNDLNSIFTMSDDLFSISVRDTFSSVGTLQLASQSAVFNKPLTVEGDFTLSRGGRMANFDVAATTGNLVIDNTVGTSTPARFIDFRSSDDQFGYIFRDSTGAGVGAWLNFYAVDSNPDYFSFTVMSATDTDLLNLDANNNVGIGKVSSGGKLEIGGATHFCTIDDDGDLFFDGDSSGMQYGHMYNNGTITVTISDNNPTEIGNTWITGEVNGVTFGASHYLVATKAGRYKIDWGLSIAQNSPSAAIQCEQGIMINGTAQNEGRAARTIANSQDVGASASNCICDLAAADQVSLFVENNTNTTNIDVEQGNLSIELIGGT